MTGSNKSKQGYIYILQNDSHNPYVIKIGLTRDAPEKRADQIYWRGTGVPVKFDIVVAFSVGDCVLAEKQIHQRLDTYRVNPRREFFKINPIVACEVSLETCEAINEELGLAPPEIQRFESGNAKCYLRKIPEVSDIEESKRELIHVPIAELKQSPIGMSRLKSIQLDRVRILHAIFREVLEISSSKYVETFTRDSNPETEIVVWEKMAKVFMAFDSLPGSDSARKKEAFKMILCRSMQPESEMNVIISDSLLEPEAIEFLLSRFRTGRM